LSLCVMEHENLTIESNAFIIILNQIFSNLIELRPQNYF